MTFNIPRTVHIRLPDIGYISIQFWRWLWKNQQPDIGDGGDDNKKPQCPNCQFHFHRYDRGRLPNDAVADVHLDPSCATVRNASFRKIQRQKPGQVYIGLCGESQDGSGSSFHATWKDHFDYTAGFHVHDNSPFQTTYAHLHLSPDNRFQFPELWNVTDFVKLLLRPPPIAQRIDSPYEATFIHNDCGHNRGRLLHQLVQYPERLKIARYSQCLNSIPRPPWIQPYDGNPCGSRPPEYFFHKDCEATRDGTKTILSSLHNYSFALENTLSKDYFTEKRWQVLLAGSVPLVWDNHNSRDSMPDEDAAVWVNKEDSGALELISRLEQYRSSYDNFYRWKERGLRTGFLRKLFLSMDYLFCRICEYVAHHHPIDIPVEEVIQKIHKESRTNYGASE